MYPRGLGLACSPVVLHLRQVMVKHLSLTTYLLVQAFSILRLFKFTTFISDSPELTLPRHPSSRLP